MSVELYFFIGSLYSYLAIMRVGALAAAAGVSLQWRPFNLRAIMVEQNNIPRNNPVKMRYVWRDLERRAANHGLPYKAGLPYPVDPDGLANRVALIAAEEGWCEAYAQAVYRDWFVEHRAPSRETLNDLLEKMGKDAASVLKRAEAPATRERFEAQTQTARELGIFGAPTFVIGRELFWGDDRLEDALAFARSRVQ
jgi:2-hydroxychromene-2-carboxylate isomerase